MNRSKYFSTSTLAKPSGPCTQFCGGQGFDETNGMCPDHYAQFVIEPLEQGLRDSNIRWRSAVEAEQQLKSMFYCECGFVGNYFQRDAHFIHMADDLNPHRPRQSPRHSPQTQTQAKSRIKGPQPPRTITEIN